MNLYKKHFYTLIGINSLLPLLLVLFMNINNESWVILIFCPIVIIVSFVLFFICWVLYFIITIGKEPSEKFHLIPQYFVTISILCFFGYKAYSTWYFKKYEVNIQYNKDFLQSNGFSNYDTLYQKAFALLENKFENKNDIRIHVLNSIGVDTIIDNIHDSVRILYFTYSFKSKSKEFASKHIIGKQVNKLLLYNVPVSFLPSLAKSLNKTLSQEENDLIQLLEYYKKLPAKEKDEEMIKIVESELERIKLNHY